MFESAILIQIYIKKDGSVVVICGRDDIYCLVGMRVVNCTSSR